MRLTRHISLVASGDGGFSLTDPYDCHAYLVESAGEAALVDTGIGSSASVIAAAVEGSGAELRHILLTHAHPDHAGGVAALARAFPRAEVLASPEVAGWVAAGDEEAMSLEAGKRADFYPRDFRFEPCPDGRPLGAGDELRVGELSVRPIATPGHAAGHLAYFVGDACLCGDLVFFGGLVSLEANWDCSLQDCAASLRRLAAEPFEALLPGHGSLSLARGRRHVEAAAERFANGFVPRSVV